MKNKMNNGILYMFYTPYSLFISFSNSFWWLPIYMLQAANAMNDSAKANVLFVSSNSLFADAMRISRLTSCVVISVIALIILIFKICNRFVINYIAIIYYFSSLLSNDQKIILPSLLSLIFIFNVAWCISLSLL